MVNNWPLSNNITHVNNRLNTSLLSHILYLKSKNAYPYRNYHNYNINMITLSRPYHIDTLWKNLDKISKYKKITLMKNIYADEIANCFIFRCDVERDPEYHLEIAEKLALKNIFCTMYFHTRKNCFHVNVMQQIQELGHEVGYHHECLDRCNGNFIKARELFLRDIDLFRKYGINILTVCSHGEGGLPKQGFKTNWELFIKYPNMLKEIGILGEVYQYLKTKQNLLYASDTFRSYKNLWSIYDQALTSTNSLMLLVHLHRWHNNISTIIRETTKDIIQHYKNKCLKHRIYDAV